MGMLFFIKGMESFNRKFWKCFPLVQKNPYKIKTLITPWNLELHIPGLSLVGRQKTRPFSRKRD